MFNRVRAARFRFMSGFIVAAATMFGTVSGSTAIEQHGVLLRQGTLLDLRVIDSRQGRQDFQQRQQLLRELDRLRLEPRQRPEIPVIQGPCQLQAYGSGYLRTCR